MFKAIFLSCIYFISINVIAQSSDTIYLWSDKEPSLGVCSNPQKKYIEEKKLTLLTEVSSPRILINEPADSIRKNAGILICPGGAYRVLSIDKEGIEIAQWLNGLGYTTFLLEYSIPKKEEQAYEEIQKAIQTIRTDTQLLKFKVDQLGLIGFSAGAHLCARASTAPKKDEAFKNQVIDAQSVNPDFTLLIYPAYLDSGYNYSLSPEIVIDSTTPPYFIFATADDKYSNSALVMTTALRNNSIPVELHIIPAGGHGYGIRKGNVAAETWPYLAEIWLKSVTEK